MKKARPPLCDHCLGVLDGTQQKLEVDGLRAYSIKLTLCPDCFNKLLATMKAGS